MTDEENSRVEMIVKIRFIEIPVYLLKFVRDKFHRYKFFVSVEVQDTFTARCDMSPVENP